MAFSLDSGPCSRLPANTQLLYRQKMSNILPAFGLQSFDAQQGGFSTQVSPHLQHRSRPFISQHYDQRCNLPARGSGSGHLDFREMEIRFFRTADLFILGREFECSETQPRNLHRVRNYWSVRLPSLKVLHLRSVTYANNKSVSKLLQGCTVLEELIVKRTFKDNARNFIVHLPTLKTLNIKVQFDKMSKLRSKYDLTINAPNLGYLEIIDWESVIHFESVFISLVEANVCYYETGLFRMVEALCNAKFLHLKWTHYCDFRALRKDEAFPLFPNLTQLELNFGTKKDETFVLESPYKMLILHSGVHQDFKI